jgi:hypothetical protein
VIKSYHIFQCEDGLKTIRENICTEEEESVTVLPILVADRRVAGEKRDTP